MYYVLPSICYERPSREGFVFHLCSQLPFRETEHCTQTSHGLWYLLRRDCGHLRSGQTTVLQMLYDLSQFTEYSGFLWPLRLFQIKFQPRRDISLPEIV
jgi:hypothetical protein